MDGCHRFLPGKVNIIRFEFKMHNTSWTDFNILQMQNENKFYKMEHIHIECNYCVIKPSNIRKTKRESTSTYHSLKYDLK